MVGVRSIHDLIGGFADVMVCKFKSLSPMRVEGDQITHWGTFLLFVKTKFWTTLMSGVISPGATPVVPTIP